MIEYPVIAIVMLRARPNRSATGPAKNELNPTPIRVAPPNRPVVGRSSFHSFMIREQSQGNEHPIHGVEAPTTECSQKGFPLRPSNFLFRQISHDTFSLVEAYGCCY